MNLTWDATAPKDPVCRQKVALAVGHGIHSVLKESKPVERRTRERRRGARHLRECYKAACWHAQSRWWAPAVP